MSAMNSSSQQFRDFNDEPDEDIASARHRDAAALLSDPLSQDWTAEPISFKRQPKQRSGSRFSLSAFFSPSSNTEHFSHSNSRARRKNIENGENYEAETWNNSVNDLSSGAGQQKKATPLDWYVEGPGRRVGYDDFTAIDWTFEYNKERQRLRHLYSSNQGLLGHIRPLVDASHVWIVLVAAGIAIGLLAAFIDIASDWLGDIKTGYCRSGREDGKFYLNRTFCCWGYDDPSQCRHWIRWRDAFHLSKAGGYIVEYIFYVLYSVFFAASASVLVVSYAPYAKHSGIPEIKSILGGLIIQKFMSSWTLMIKSLGLCLAVASGLWLGKEGPLVHVACCCAELIMKPIGSLNRNEAIRREVLSAAAAAGISVAFGSPIGGVLFSLEQLSYYFPDKTMWQSFVCAMVAAVTLQALNPFRTGKIVLYQVTYTRGWHSFEILPFIFLGILGGVYGGLFIKLNHRLARWRQERKFLPVVEVAIVALVSAVANFPNKFMRAQLSELVHYLFAQCSDSPDDPFSLCRTGAASFGVISLLLTAAIAGFFFASITFGLDIPCGIILPSLAIGALYGRAMGIFFEMWQQAYPHFFLFASCKPDVPCITPGLYAIIGAASALGGATRMTVSIVAIMFELTGALTYVIPIMIAVMLSKWCGDVFGKRSIYESWIHLKEYPFLDQKDDTALPDIPIRQVMTNINDLSVITASGNTIESLQQLLACTRYRGFPVVRDTVNPILLGYISRNELSYALKTATDPAPNDSAFSPETPAYFAHQPFADPREIVDLRPWMNQTPITMNSNTNFAIVLNMFQRLGLRYVLFGSRGRLEGFLTKKDIWYIIEGFGERGTRSMVFQEHGTEEDGLVTDEAEGRRLFEPLRDSL